jgi:hypothetical protein
LVPGYVDLVDSHEFIHTLMTGHVTRLTCFESAARTARRPYTYVPGIRNQFPAEDVCPYFLDFSPLDLMGQYWNAWGNVNAALKKQFGWLHPENTVMTRSGSYTLNPLDSSATASGTLMIEIPIPYTMASYILEHRAEAPLPGVYAYLAISSGPPSFVIPYLLSTEPYTVLYAPAEPLRLGLTTLDAAMELDVTVVSSSSAGATLTISSNEDYVTQCTDGVWNGRSYGWDSIDAADYSCQAGNGLSEIDPAPQCSNGIDDDGDGPYDQYDADCPSHQDDSE